MIIARIAKIPQIVAMLRRCVRWAVWGRVRASAVAVCAGGREAAFPGLLRPRHVRATVRGMAYAPSSLRFAACSFDRVFDTEPKQELMTLEALLQFLSRFEVKPQVLQRMEREVARVQRSFDRVQNGQSGAGPIGARIREALQDAERTAAGSESAGADVEAAGRAVLAKLQDEAKRSVKRDLRLWSPTLYRPGARRGSDHVLHLSCLVLDYDAGTRIEAASEQWSRWLHVAHSTWSFRPEHHKFRLVLPLAEPVAAEDWPEVWAWASARTGGAIDPALSGAGAMFAIPTVPNAEWPRAHIAHDGPLLSVVNEGVIASAASGGVPEDVVLLQENTLVTGRRKYRSIHAPIPFAVRTAPDVAWERDELWDPFGDGAAPASPEPAPAAHASAELASTALEPARPVASQETGVTMEEFAALQRRVARLEQTLEQASAQRPVAEIAAERVVSALERLLALHESGALDADEFELAKRAVLRDE